MGHKDAQNAPPTRRNATLTAHLGRILYTPLDVKSTPKAGTGIRRRKNGTKSSLIWYSGLNQPAFRLIFYTLVSVSCKVQSEAEGGVLAVGDLTPNNRVNVLYFLRFFFFFLKLFAANCGVSLQNSWRNDPG